MTSPATAQAQTYGCELAHLDIPTICDRLEHMKRLVLQTQSLRISTTQGNNSVSKRSTSEDPGSRVFSRNQRPRIKPMTVCSECSQVKVYGQKGILGDKIFLFFSVFCFVLFLFFEREVVRAEGRYEGVGE